MKTLVLIPTYNERDNLPVLVKDLMTIPGVSAMVLDDQSPDGTGKVADGLARDYPGRVLVLHRTGQRGLGVSYLEGFRNAIAGDWEYVCQMDADLSHDPKYLPEMRALAASGADLVIGSRYVAGGSIPEWPLLRRAISRIGCRYARMMLRVPIQDATSGFRAYRAETLTAIDLDEVRADGYGFQVEMAYRVHNMGGRIAEVPIEFRDRTLGRSKMSMRIVVEALWLVTRWGLRDRVRPSRHAA